MIFSGTQAVCVVVATGLAIYGLFWTSLPESIIRQMRGDIAAAKEEIVDLRQQRREIDQQLEMTQKKLDDVRGELEAKASAVAGLEATRRALALQIESISGERQKYFANTFGVVVRDLVDGLRRGFSVLRKTALKAREYPEFKVWVAVGHERFPTAGGEWDRGRMDLWLGWYQQQPQIWAASDVGEDLERELAKAMDLVRLGFSKDAPTPARLIDLSVYDRRIQEFEHEITSGAAQSITAPAVIEFALREAGLERLTDEDRGRLRSRVQHFFSREADALTEPLTVNLPAGWTDEGARLRGEAVLTRLDRIEVLVTALQDDLAITRQESH